MSAILSFFLNTTGGRLILGVIVFLTWLTFHDARVAERAREGYVARSEKLAAEARAEEEARQRKAAEDSLNEFRRELSISAAEENRRSKELSDALTENEALRKSRGFSAADVDYIMCQRQGSPSRCRSNNNRPVSR